jgi:hypothetical protein
MQRGLHALGTGRLNIFLNGTLECIDADGASCPGSRGIPVRRTRSAYRNTLLFRAYVTKFSDTLFIPFQIDSPYENFRRLLYWH